MHQTHQGPRLPWGTLRVRECCSRDFPKGLHHLMTALDFGDGGINRVEIYDNSANLADEKNVQRIMSMRQGRVTSLASNVPSWLEHLLKGTKFEIPALREFLQLRANRRSHDLGR